MTYIVNYRQFKRGRRSNHSVSIQANSRREAQVNFLGIINLVQQLQNYHPFYCNQVHIVSIFKEVKHGQN